MAAKIPTPTNNPVPSGDIRDHVFAGAKLDEVVTSSAHFYTDRLGVRRWTIAGINYTASQAISQFGYITMDSFEHGATLTLPNQTLRYEANGEYYRWDGEYPQGGKVVPANSTPDSTGGVDFGAWVSVGDASLRTDLFSNILYNSNGYTSLRAFYSVKDGVNGAKGNGVDDDTDAIQIAVNSHTSIIIPPGDYRVTKRITIPSNTRVYCYGNIKSEVTDNNVFVVDGVENVVLIGLRVNTSVSRQISGQLCNAVLIRSSKNVVVDRCDFYTSIYSRGVSVYSSEKVKVINNYVTSPDLTPSVNGSTIADAVYIGDGAREVIVDNNNLFNVGAGVGVQVVGTGNIYNVIVTNNVIGEVASYGAYVYFKPGSEVRRVIISNNIIDTVYGSFYNTATTLPYTHGAGIYLQGVFEVMCNGNITRNTCINTDSETLSPAGIAAVDVINASIRNNLCEISYRYGVIADGVDVSVTDNTIVNNKKAHIYSRGSTRLLINGNTTRSDPSNQFASVQGVLLTEADNKNHNSPTITSNNMSNAHTAVYLGNSYNALVAQNNTYNEGVATFAGIQTSVSGSNAKITNNNLQLNGGYGIRARSAGAFVDQNSITGAVLGQALEIPGPASIVGTNQIDKWSALDNANGVTMATATWIRPTRFGINGTSLIITGAGTINGIVLPESCRLTDFFIRAPVGTVFKNMTTDTTGIKFRMTSGSDETVSNGNKIYHFRNLGDGILEQIS